MALSAIELGVFAVGAVEVVLVVLGVVILMLICSVGVLPVLAGVVDLVDAAFQVRNFDVDRLAAS